MANAKVRSECTLMHRFLTTKLWPSLEVALAKSLADVNVIHEHIVMGSKSQHDTQAASTVERLTCNQTLRLISAIRASNSARSAVSQRGFKACRHGFTSILLNMSYAISGATFDKSW